MNINRILRQIQKFQKNYVKFEFFGQKNLFLRQKAQKSLETLETVFSECLEISEILKFRTFQKLQKMTFNLKFENCKKLVPKTDSKVRLKVWNAGP